MATETDLTGLGMSPFLASKIGLQPSNLTCTGTSQATAATALTKNVILNAQSSQTGAILPASAGAGQEHWLFNGSASTQSAVVYVPSGHSLNGNLNDGATVTAGTALIMIQAANKVWFKK